MTLNQRCGRVIFSTVILPGWIYYAQVPYPLIALVTRLPQTLSGQCPINFRCRTFESFSLFFDREDEALDVFESVKELTVSRAFSSISLVLDALTLSACSVYNTALRVLLRTKPTTYRQRWLVLVLC